MTCQNLGALIGFFLFCGFLIGGLVWFDRSINDEGE